ncbi:MAG: enoyl-CoA hydratase/isomerase family protein [Caulobacteraceae bacterium]
MALASMERRGGAAVISYANPPLGTMTAKGAEEVLEAVKTLAEDPACRAIVLTGGLEGVFIRHYDVGELASLSERLGEAPPAAARAPTGGGAFAQLVDLIWSAPKPVIAAINGLCMGGGFEIALACDLRIASADVTAIGLPETRVGIFPGGGGTQRLPRIIGEAKALEMILLGRVVAAPDALSIGLVHEVAPNALTRALEIAADFEPRGAEGLAHAKRLVRAALDVPISEGLAAERASFVEVMRTPSARAGLAAARPPARIEES